MKKERSKQGQTNKQGKATQHTHMYMFMHMSYELLRILYNIRMGILLRVRRLCWYNFDHNRRKNTVSIIVAHLRATVLK